MNRIFKTAFPLLLITLLLVACNDPQPKPKFKLAGVGEPNLPAFSFPDLEGTIRESSEWKGDVLVINFWATWCPPCREEMPRFIDLQKKYGAKKVTVLGVAIDNPSDVQDFVDVYEIDFPILIGDINGIKLSNRMGNRFDSLPFTAIYDRKGKITFAQAGEVSWEDLENNVKPLL